MGSEIKRRSSRAARAAALAKRPKPETVVRWCWVGSIDGYCEIQYEDTKHAALRMVCRLRSNGWDCSTPERHEFAPPKRKKAGK